MSKRILRVMCLALCMASPAHSYELATHANLSYEAYKRSRIATNVSILTGLGAVEKGLDEGMGETYIETRKRQDKFEITYMPTDVKDQINGRNIYSPYGWLMRGAIREDDYPDGYKNVPPQPLDDPYYSDLRRPVNHFFDPYYNRPLTPNWLLQTLAGLTGTSMERSVDWALGVNDAYATPLVVNGVRKNHGSVHLARKTAKS